MRVAPNCGDRLTTKRDRIAISQRVVQVAEVGERRDELDQRWPRLLERNGYASVGIPNSLDEPERWLRELDVALIILSGGNDLGCLDGGTACAPERDATERRVLSVATDAGIPVLGICRGLQMLVHYWGGELQRGAGHRASEHLLTHTNTTDIAIRSGTVNSYHDWIITAGALPDSLIPLALAPDGTVEAVRHQQHPQFGVMWHPERDSYDHTDMLMINDLVALGRACGL